MPDHEQHDWIVRGLTEQLQELFDASPQGMYLYLDDMHKSCNAVFASLLGYPTPEAWAAVTDPFMGMVDDESQERLATHYHQAMEQAVGSRFSVTWKTVTGQRIPSEVILVPTDFEGHRLALHFVTPTKHDSASKR